MKNTCVQKLAFSDHHFKLNIYNKSADQSERAFHEELEIKLFYEGHAMQMIGSEIFITDPGDITITNPYEIHSNMEHKLYQGKYYLFMIDLDFFTHFDSTGLDLRTILLTDGRHFQNRIRKDERLSGLLLQVVREMEEKKTYYHSVVYHVMSEFFLLLLREYLCLDTSQSHLMTDLKRSDSIAPALSKIFSDFGKRITIDELAELCHISKYHFCRLFKEEMGVTAIHYITEYRISIAEVMLKQKGKSIEEIAAFCGFNDPSYFYRCYKKIKGYSPRNQ